MGNQSRVSTSEGMALDNIHVSYVYFGICTVLTALAVALVAYDGYLTWFNTLQAQQAYANFNTVSGFYQVDPNPALHITDFKHVPVAVASASLPMTLDLTAAIADGNTLTGLQNAQVNTVTCDVMYASVAQAATVTMRPDAMLPFTLPDPGLILPGQCFTTQAGSTELTWTSCASSALNIPRGSLVIGAGPPPTGGGTTFNNGTSCVLVDGEYWTTAQPSDIFSTEVSGMQLIRYDSQRVGIGLTAPGKYLISYWVEMSIGHTSFPSSSAYLATSQGGIMAGTRMLVPPFLSGVGNGATQYKTIAYQVLPGTPVDITIRAVCAGIPVYRWTLAATGPF